MRERFISMIFPESNQHENRGTPFIGFPRTLELCIEDVIPNMNEYRNLAPHELLNRISIDYLERPLDKAILSYGQFKVELNRLAHEILKKKRGAEFIRRREEYTYRNGGGLLKPMPKQTCENEIFLKHNTELKRPKTYVDYLSEALNSFPTREASTQEIYQFFIDNFMFLIRDKRNWKISVRVNLSRSDKFCLSGEGKIKKWGFTSPWDF